MIRFLFSFFIVPALLFTAPAFGADEAQQSDAASFTNKDLEQYNKLKTPENETPGKPQSGSEYGSRDIHKRKTDKRSDQKEQEYWCKKGKQAGRKIETCRDEVRALKELIDEFRQAESSSVGKKRTAAGKNIRKAEKNLAAAQRRLKEKELVLSDLAEEAHRKSIPAGWLRCQFE